MSDLIRRQDAIDALVNHACFGIEELDNLCNASVADSEGWLGGIRDAIKEVQGIPSAEPELKWIPVTEALPEEDKDVLVFGVEAISNEYVYSVKRWDVDTWRPRIAQSIRWIAWMPLPEPYRGDR